MKKITLIIILMFPHVGWSLDALDGKSIICEKINRVDFPIAGIYGFRFIGNKVSGDFLLTKNYEVTIYNFNNYSMKSITVDFISWLDRDIGMGWKLNRETLILNHIVNNGPTSSKYQCNVMPDLETYNKEMEAYRLEHFKKLKDKLRKNKI